MFYQIFKIYQINYIKEDMSKTDTSVKRTVRSIYDLMDFTDREDISGLLILILLIFKRPLTR